MRHQSVVTIAKVAIIAATSTCLLVTPGAMGEEKGSSKTPEDIALGYLKGSASGGEREIAEAGIDAAIGLIELGFPGAGPALGVLKGFFAGEKKDANAAIAVLDKRLDVVEADIRTLSANFDALAEQVDKGANMRRLGVIGDRQREVRRLARQLHEIPTMTAIQKRNLVDNTLDFANSFLADMPADEDLWYWNDIRLSGDPNTKTVQVRAENKKFQIDLLLETYLQSVMVLVAAIESTGDNITAEQKSRHTAFLTSNPTGPDGKPLDWPAPLPERAAPIVCSRAVTRLSDREGVCQISISCRSTEVRRAFVPFDRGDASQYCLYGESVAKLAGAEEDQLREALASNASGQAAEVMRLAAKAVGGAGQLEDPKFDHTYYYPQYFYGVTAEGELVEYIHEISEDRNPQDRLRELDIKTRASAQAPVANPPAMLEAKPSRAVRDAIVGKAAPPPPDSVAAATVRESGKVAAAVKPQPVWRHKLVGPQRVATGWSPQAKAYPGGVYGPGAAIYVVTPDGVMRWLRHDDFRGGPGKWTAPVQVATGWNIYTRMFAAGDGVVYGIDPAGDLYWYRHLEAANAGPQPKWTPRVKVGSGWGQFVHVFAGGEGVVYAVKPDGRLHWYRHTAYLTGAPTWLGLSEVGTGWNHFRSVYATGEGRIYAVQPNGELYYYQHTGWADGSKTWLPPQVLGPGFDRFAWIFPAMWGTPKEDVVR